MKDADRFKLYFGPYKTPPFKYDQKVWCEFRGWTKTVGLSDGTLMTRLVSSGVTHGMVTNSAD